VHSLMTLVNSAVPSIGVSGAHHLFLLLSDPLSAGTAHFAILALRLETSFQVCDRVSFETPPDHFLSGKPTLYVCASYQSRNQGQICNWSLGSPASGYPWSLSIW
jgi:hypothetical protein